MSDGNEACLRGLALHSVHCYHAYRPVAHCIGWQYEYCFDLSGLALRSVGVALSWF